MPTKKLAAIVIGGSAGALDALGVILPALPAGLPVPVVIAVHMLASKPSGLPRVLQDVCALEVKEAEDKEPIAPGKVYLASPNYHLLVEKEHHFSLSVDEHVHFSRPAIDVLFETAAAAYGSALAGVLLSGANEDGAHGLATIKAARGTTVVQAPETATARAMPEAALRRGSVDHLLSPAEIGPLLVELANAETLPWAGGPKAAP